MSTCVMLYLPVIHAGYERFLQQHQNADRILLLGTSFAERNRALGKEIRALAPQRAAEYLRAVHGIPVDIVEQDDLPAAVSASVLTMPDEDVMRDIADVFGLGEVAELRFERTFLRWDREWSLAGRPVDYDGTISTDELDRLFGRAALAEAEKSSDWWRQVGAIAVRSGEIVGSAYNRHCPSEYSPYLNGDPRNNFRRGLHQESSTALHAEAALISEAARSGVSLAGADVFVSTFPCANCARLIAAAGFARCCFLGPYSVLDGEEILRTAGVELLFVDLADS